MKTLKMSICTFCVSDKEILFFPKNISGISKIKIYENVYFNIIGWLRYLNTDKNISKITLETCVPFLYKD